MMIKIRIVVHTIVTRNDNPSLSVGMVLFTEKSIVVIAPYVFKRVIAYQTLKSN